MLRIISTISIATAAALLAGGGAVQSGHAATNGLVAAYSFNEGSGTVLHDTSGNGNTGAISGAAWKGGHDGSALDFNGSSSMVTIPNDASLAPTNGVTVEAWVRPSSVRSWRAVAVKEQTQGSLSYGLYAASDAGPAALVYTSAEQQVKAPARLGMNRWTHLAEVYTGTSLLVYVNGTLASQQAVAGGIAEGTGALRIGGDSIWNEWFNGRIDDLRVYNRALSANEVKADLSTPVSDATPAVDTTAPSTPSGLTVTGSTPTSIGVGWVGSSDNVGVAGYTLRRNGVTTATTTGTSGAFSGLACGTSYTLTVDAFDVAGNHSAQASVTGATSACTDAQAPTVPAGLAVSAATQTSISVGWVASSDNVGVAGYTLRRNGTTAGTTAGTSSSFTGLACGTSYTLTVDAFDGAGNHSAQASVTSATSACTDTQAPSTPAGFAATSATQTSITVAWSASSDNVAVSGYTVYLNSVGVSQPTSTTATLSGLTCGTLYTVGVDAFDASGNHSAQTSVSASTTACPDAQAPSVPAGLAATGSSQTTINVSWNASSDNVGVSGYGLYRNTVSTGTTTSTSASFSGLSCGTSYTLAVDGFDAAANHSAKASLVASTAACSGGATANLWVDPSGGSCSRQASAGAWNDAQGCASIQAAVAACTPGDTIGMKAGSYGAQTISTNLPSPGCTVIAESGVTAGKLATNGNWLTIQGGSFAGWEPAGSNGQPHDIHLVGTTVTSQVWFENCCSNITMTGGSISGVNDGGAPAAVMVEGLTAATPISNITFDGVEFKNANCTSAGNHYEVVRTQGWATNLTIKNSYFHDNGVNSSQIFISSFTGGTDHTPGPIKIENTFFGPPVAPSCGPGPAYFQINGNMQGQPCPDLTVDYNTSLSALTTIWDANGANCSSGQANIRFKANIAPKSAGNCGANTWDHNLWINSSNANCGTGDQTLATTIAAGLTGDGFHLTTTSPARAAGDPSNCPSTDHDGNPRANPTGTTCDTGAIEKG